MVDECNHPHEIFYSSEDALDWAKQRGALIFDYQRQLKGIKSLTVNNSVAIRTQIPDTTLHIRLIGIQSPSALTTWQLKSPVA